MAVLKIIAYLVVILYILSLAGLYFYQTRLLFFPGKLPSDFKFRLGGNGEEVFLKTPDGETINGIFYQGPKDQVILYFHGNAGDLSGWQFVGEDLSEAGFSSLIIDYRGYGKSSGEISEKGFNIDAETAYHFLLTKKEFTPANVIVYGRSIGTGVATKLASGKQIKGLVLEAPYTSVAKLANEKVPFFFPSIYLKYRFDNLSIINDVRCPVIFIHGEADELIPARHSKKLFAAFNGKKRMIAIKKGQHNDLNDFPEYKEFLAETIDSFFSGTH